MEGTQPSMLLLPQVCRSALTGLLVQDTWGPQDVSGLVLSSPPILELPPSHRNRFCSAPFQVSVALSSSSIRVAVLEESGEQVLMEGKFTHKVNTESSLWSLEPGKCVLVSATLCAPREAPPSGLRGCGDYCSRS